MRSVEWTCRGRILKAGPRPLIMGILNVTPDSFSDGGLYLDPAAAIERGRRMLAEGADIIDVGGESTRPGAEDVPAEEEARRVLPVIAALAGESGAVVSVDTVKAAVARKALAAGARILNDVSGMRRDPEMEGVARESGAGVILMHMQGNPRTMQVSPTYGDVVREVSAFLRERAEELTRRGIEPASLAVDPGIGFGKTLEHNLALLRHLEVLVEMGRPVVIGVSRKSFLGRLTGRETNQRLAGSLAALGCCVAKGAHVLRVHDVQESRDAAAVAVALGDNDVAMA